MERVRKKTRIELNQEARTNEQKIIQEDNEKKEASQMLVIKEKEMDEKISENHLKKRKNEQADQVGSRKRNREGVEPKVHCRELRSTRRQQMQKNEKETWNYTGLRSGRPREKDMAELSLSSRYRDAPD